MPGGNRTGPMGAGTMTGRRAGYCAGYRVPGFDNPAMPWPEIGFGYRVSRRGWRHRFHVTDVPCWQGFSYIPPTPQEEAETLKAQASWLKEQLGFIQKHLEELEQKKRSM